MMSHYARHGTAGGDLPARGRPVAWAPAGHAIDWHRIWQAGRACCCPAEPVVVAVMPPGPGRDHVTDLLLCGHHYRASRWALLAAGATVYDKAGHTVMPPPEFSLRPVIGVDASRDAAPAED